MACLLLLLLLWLLLLLLLLLLQDIAVSSGSACTSASLEPSLCVEALGVEEEHGAHLHQVAAACRILAGA